MITKAEMMEAGKQHAAAGGVLTPFDCRNVDAKIFAAMKHQERPAKFYADMRGAFNKGWEQEFNRIVFSAAA